ncbi:MAG: anhydro-N-acetylmuramic acid kinase [Chitinophagales bacterium]
MDKGREYQVLGLMSGSSLDGLDIAWCKIRTGSTFQAEIIAAKTFPYTREDIAFLQQVSKDVSVDTSAESVHFAEISSRFVLDFIAENHIEQLDCIASHGHTIWHHPELGKTLQIGDGQTLANAIGFPVINNFRQADIDAGGQGAPLVPMCDVLLFSAYDACLNIGGIANISFEVGGKRVGYDICGANQLLNACAALTGNTYDHNGEIARSGRVKKDLFEKLNADPFLQKPYPRSLDNGYVDAHFTQLLLRSEGSAEDKMATAVEHITTQISDHVKRHAQIEGKEIFSYTLFITGGGAYNNYLVYRIAKLCGVGVIPTNRYMIEFKESLAMACMAVLRMEKKPNFIPSVTGARFAACGGEIHYPD